MIRFKVIFNRMIGKIGSFVFKQNTITLLLNFCDNIKGDLIKKMLLL